MHGGGAIRAKWPEQATQPSREDRIALQRKLASLGYKVRNFTGHLDFDLRDAIRLEQVSSACCPTAIPVRNSCKGSVRQRPDAFHRPVAASSKA
jgi:membrane-bound lytic murein transglycosylase B